MKPYYDDDGNATMYPGQVGWRNRDTGELRPTIRAWEAACGVLGEKGPVWQFVWAVDAIQHLVNEVATLRRELERSRNVVYPVTQDAKGLGSTP